LNLGGDHATSARSASSQAHSPATDKPSRNDRIAIAAARHRQLARSLQKRADAIRDKSDGLGAAPVAHGKVLTGARHLPGVGAAGHLPAMAKGQADLDHAAGRLAHRAVKHGQRALGLEKAANRAKPVEVAKPAVSVPPAVVKAIEAKRSLREQSDAHKADRWSGYDAKQIRAETKFVKALPKEAKSALAVAKRYDDLPQSHYDNFHPPTSSIREGIIRLRDKKLSDGQRQAIARSFAAPVASARAAIAAHKAGLPAPR
jgi:hypothetical protein